MKKIVAFLLLVSFCTSIYSQTIQGVVLDRNNNSPIQSATIYFNGTFSGVLSDEQGYFELDNSDYKSMPITISSLGYYSFGLSDFPTDKQLIIFLTPKVFELDEIVVTAIDIQKARKRNLRMFKREFLGKTPNARKCKIMNEDDISLVYDDDNKKLKAFSSKPILIENRALGFKITYYLDKFEYNKITDYLLLTGNYNFIEDSAIRWGKQKRIERRRKSTYLGSRMHFFRALWANNLNSTLFAVENSAYVKLSYHEYVSDTDSLGVKGQMQKYLKSSGNLIVTYFSKEWSESRIEIIKGYIQFNKNGYFDPLGIIWEGDMAKQRVGDLLPFEYQTK